MEEKTKSLSQPVDRNKLDSDSEAKVERKEMVEERKWKDKMQKNL